MLMHAVAHWGPYGHCRSLHWKLIPGEVKRPLPHGGLEPLSVLCLAFQSDALPSELFPPLLWVICVFPCMCQQDGGGEVAAWSGFKPATSWPQVPGVLHDQGSNMWPLDPESQVCCMVRVWTCDLLILSLRFNNNNKYLEHLTCTSPKRLHILYKYILSKFSAYNMNAHTHTHTHAHTHTQNNNNKETKQNYVLCFALIKSVILNLSCVSILF